jgi:sugar phosphate isomerase/epimerase
MDMEQNVSRRGFIGAAIGTGAAAAVSPSVALAHGWDDRGRGTSGRVPRDRRGIQLYTLRRLMPDQTGARRVLNALGRMGYTEVETAGHYGWTVQEFRRELRRAGLRASSGHDGPGFPATAGWESGYRDALEYAAELGQRLTGFAWFPSTPAFPYSSEATWHALAQVLNTAGRIAREEYGLTFFYHNHDFEFLNRFGGRPAYDILQAETDRRYVKFELDLFWITEGGANAVEYLSAHPDWYVAYHVKDHVWGDRRAADGSDLPDWEDAGPGMLDFPDLFDAGDRTDKHYFIEHDDPQLSHPGDPEAELTTARNGIRYLQAVRW